MYIIEITNAQWRSGYWFNFCDQDHLQGIGTLRKELEKTYQARLKIGESVELVFMNEEDATAFILRWS